MFGSTIRCRTLGPNRLPSGERYRTWHRGTNRVAGSPQATANPRETHHDCLPPEPWLLAVLPVADKTSAGPNSAIGEAVRQTKQEWPGLTSFSRVGRYQTFQRKASLGWPLSVLRFNCRPTALRSVENACRQWLKRLRKNSLSGGKGVPSGAKARHIFNRLRHD